MYLTFVWHFYSPMPYTDHIITLPSCTHCTLPSTYFYWVFMIFFLLLCFVATAYRAELDRLQPQILPPATFCAPECNTRALCYTDYLPNWNPSHLLDRVIVASSIATSPDKGWVKVSKGSRDANMGYLDIKIVYEVSVLHISHILSFTTQLCRTNIMSVCLFLPF